MDLSPDELTKAKNLAPNAKHFQKVLYNGTVLLFRNPTRPEYKMFRQLFDQEGSAAAPKAFDALAAAVVIQPTPAEWEASFLEEYPGAGVSNDVVKALSILTGMASEETLK